MYKKLVVEETYQLTIKLPGGKELKIIVSCQITKKGKGLNNLIQTSPREAIQDIKQSIMESPDTCANSCFYLAFNGQRVNDYLELCDIEGITSESELELIEGKL